MARPVPGSSALPDAVRRHRIYYEVQRESAQYGERRIVVAVQVWLWATLEKGRGVLPGSPGCRDAVETLHALAREAISRSAAAPPPDLEPFRWAPYESKLVPGTDEVRVELNFRAAPGVDGPEQVARERSLQAVRRALEGLGVAHGAYRGGPTPITPEPAEAWIERPVLGALGGSAARPVPDGREAGRAPRLGAVHS
jgi:hypothetical protein